MTRVGADDSVSLGLVGNSGNHSEGHAAIGLDDSLLPVAPIIVGIPKNVPAHAPRRKAQVHWV